MPDECRTTARSSACAARVRSACWSCAAKASTSPSEHRQQRQPVAGHLAALRDLLLAAEADDRGRLRLIDERRQLGLVEHRRQRRQHDPAMQAAEHRDRGLDRVPTQQDHDVAGLDATVREAVGHAQGRAAELVVRDPPVVEHQGHAVAVLLCARVEIAPQVSVAPITLGVVALGLRLKGQRRLGHLSLLRSRQSEPTSI